MPITSTHPEYKKWSPKWNRCRHFVEGEDAVKAHGTTYLPALDPKAILNPDEQKRYEAYKDRAPFYGASGRTVEGLVGAVHRKEPVFKVPEQLKPRLEDLTGTGVSAVEFCKLMVAELLTTARLGLLVDKAENEDTSLATLSMYVAENIPNWLDGGKTAVVLKEMALEPKDNDPYELHEVTVYRELAIVEGGYVQQIHRPRKAGSTASATDYAVAKVVAPRMRGKALAEIPFVFVSPRGATNALAIPPILPLVNVNMSHFRLSADYEHGLHWTALPTPVFCGLDDEKSELAMGPQGGIVLPVDGKAMMLEFTGQGLSAVEAGLQAKERHMATLGAQLLTPPKGVEAADTAKIHQSGQVVTLHTIAQAVEEALEKALTMIAAWEGISGEIEVEMNKEFIEATIDPKLLASVLQAWQAGGIDLDTFLYNMQKYGFTNPDDTIEDIKKRIDDETAKAQEAADRAFNNQQDMMSGGEPNAAGAGGKGPTEGGGSDGQEQG